MPTSPTQRSTKFLREQGYTTYITERWNSFAKIRQDLFGFIDLVAIKDGFPIAGIQTTSGSNISARIAKILELEAARVWLRAGGAIYVHGWKKLKPRGVKVAKWHCDVRQITLETFIQRKPEEPKEDFPF